MPFQLGSASSGSSKARDPRGSKSVSVSALPRLLDRPHCTSGTRAASRPAAFETITGARDDGSRRVERDAVRTASGASTVAIRCTATLRDAGCSTRRHCRRRARPPASRRARDRSRPGRRSGCPAHGARGLVNGTTPLRDGRATKSGRSAGDAAPARIPARRGRARASVTERAARGGKASSRRADHGSGARESVANRRWLAQSRDRLARVKRQGAFGYDAAMLCETCPRSCPHSPRSSARGAGSPRSTRPRRRA